MTNMEFRVHSSPRDFATPPLTAKSAKLPFGNQILFQSIKVQSLSKLSTLDSTTVKARQQIFQQTGLKIRIQRTAAFQSVRKAKPCQIQQF